MPKLKVFELHIYTFIFSIIFFFIFISPLIRSYNGVIIRKSGRIMSMTKYPYIYSVHNIMGEYINKPRDRPQLLKTAPFSFTQMRQPERNYSITNPRYLYQAREYYAPMEDERVEGIYQDFSIQKQYEPSSKRVIAPTLTPNGQGGYYPLASPYPQDSPSRNFCGPGPF